MHAAHYAPRVLFNNTSAVPQTQSLRSHSLLAQTAEVTRPGGLGIGTPPPTCLRAIRGICAKSMNTLSHRLSHTAATYQALYNYPEQRLYTAQPVKMQQNLQISTSNVKELLHTARAPKPQPYNLLL